MKIIFIIIFLALLGCHYAPKPDWRGKCTIRPIVITSDSQTRWTSNKIETRQEIASKMYENVGLELTFLSVEYMENKELYDIKGLETLPLFKLSKKRSERNHELAVFLVNSLTQLDGKTYGGISNYPSNLLGSYYQHGIIISASSGIHILAHEIGHAFNLPHTWKDKFSDTTSNDKKDCDTEAERCNIMSYCNHVIPCEPNLRITEQQKNEVRKWATVYPRNQVVSEITSKIIDLQFAEYTNNIEAVDCE